MFKGVGRQVVVLRNTDSQIFEEAIFIIKDGAKVSKPDMLTECERIIRNNYTGNRKYITKRKNAKTKILFLGIAAAILFIATIITVISCL